MKVPLLCFLFLSLAQLGTTSLSRSWGHIPRTWPNPVLDFMPRSRYGWTVTLPWRHFEHYVARGVVVALSFLVAWRIGGVQ